MSAVLSCSNGHLSLDELKASASLTIFYLRFSIETYLPVTADTVEQRARCTLSFKPSSDDIERLRGIMGQLETGGFDGKRVRLKMIGFGDQPIFVDAIGGVRRGSVSVGRLSKTGFESLSEFMEFLAKREGCDLSK
jgi:hypothetical protein